MRHDAKALLVPPASGEPVSLAPSDIAVGAKIGAKIKRRFHRRCLRELRRLTLYFQA